MEPEVQKLCHNYCPMNWAANHVGYHIRKWANILSVDPAVQQLHDVQCCLVEPFDLFKSNKFSINHSLVIPDTVHF